MNNDPYGKQDLIDRDSLDTNGNDSAGEPLNDHTVILNGKEATGFNSQPSDKKPIILFIIALFFPLIIFSVVIFQSIQRDLHITGKDINNNGIIESPRLDTMEQNSTPPEQELNSRYNNTTNQNPASSSTNGSNNRTSQSLLGKCETYTATSPGTINKNWKKYSIDKCGFSFEYPANLKDFKSNKIKDYIIYQAIVGDLDNPDNDPNNKSSSAVVTVQNRSTYGGTYDLVDLNTGMGKVTAYYRKIRYYYGMQYTYEFKVNDTYYNYELYNSSQKTDIMTAEEFKQLVESSTIGG